jgi:hypothetical protein
MFESEPVIRSSTGASDANTLADNPESNTLEDVDEGSGVADTTGALVDFAASAFDEAGEADDELDESGTDFGPIAEKVKAEARGMYDRATEDLQAWWSERDNTTRAVLLISSSVGAVVGLIFGLLAPYVAASFQSAVVGAILIYFSAVQLLTQLTEQPPTWLPTSPRIEILIVGLITLVGFAVQWTVFRKKTDK